MTTTLATRGAMTATICLSILIMVFLGTGCKKAIDEPMTTTDASDEIVAATPATSTKLYYNSAAQLSLPRAGIVAAAAGNKILFAGGYLPIDGDINVPPSPLSRVDIFDATTLQRTTHQLSVARWGIGAAALGNKIFFAGGWMSQSNGYSNRVDIYDASNNTWTTATLSQPRGLIAVAASGSKVIFAGGVKSNSYPYYSSVIDIYDVNTGVWTTTSFMNNWAPKATATKGDIAIVASTPGTYSPKALIYHTAGNSWTNLNLTYYGNANAGNDHRMFAVSAGSKMLFGFGGDDPISKVVNVVQAGTNINNPTIVNSPRMNVGVCNSGNFGFIAGGVYFDTHFNENPSNLINVYNGALNAWTISTLHTPATDVKAASANNTVMFAGLKHMEWGYHEVQIYKLAGQPPIAPVR